MGITTILLFFQAVGFDLPLVTSLAAFIALPVKGSVDIVKGAWTRLPSNALPLVGVVVAYVFCVVVLLATKHPFEASIYAQCFLAAVIAQLGAMAATAGQDRANKNRELAQSGRT